jgi:hypothetical protein
MQQLVLHMAPCEGRASVKMTSNFVTVKRAMDEEKILIASKKTNLPI